MPSLPWIRGFLCWLLLLGFASAFPPVADFIVVGSGVAGAVAAGRLARLPGNPIVTLIEAGGPTPEEVFSVPGKWGRACNFNLNFPCSSNWGYAPTGTGPEPPRLWMGKNRGGTGEHNGMHYYKGAVADFELWSELGPEYADIWSPSEMEQAYKSIEDGSTLAAESPGVYGEEGAISVSAPIYQDTKAQDIYFAAWESLGLPALNDVNGPSVDEGEPATLGGLAGPGICRFNIDPEDATRSSAFVAYIEPLLEEGKENFFLAEETTVRRVLLEEVDGEQRAIGVEIMSASGEISQIVARREVILSAGALNTPKILMNSGIGPADDLEEVGITPVLDLPVGQKLADHVSLRIFWGLSDDSDCLCRQSDVASPDINAQYEEEPPAGQLTTSGPAAVVFFRQPESEFNYDTNGVIENGPNLEFTMEPYPGFIHEPSTGLFPSKGYRNNLTLNQPSSRGTFKLNPEDTFGDPIISPGYFTTDEDIELAWQGLQKSRELLETPALASRGARETFPGVESVPDFDAFKSRLTQYDTGRMRQATNHHSGSAPMGPDGVVDATLLVHGTSNLRIADASVMPGYGVSVNPQATIMAIGAVAARFAGEAAAPQGLLVDPTCSSGIKNNENDACCPVACGSCGGTGCHWRPGGSQQCCSSGIRSSAPSCNTSRAPCVISDSGPASDPAFSSLGCFADQVEARDLTGDMQRFPGTNSQETCFAHCSGLGFEVFANQYGVECFCGSQVELGSYGPSDGCVFPCPGNGSQLCGGSDANQVYLIV